MFRQEFEEKKKQIETELIRYLPDVDPSCGILGDAMKYSLEAGGKRIRPVLLLSSSAMCGGSAEEAMPFACALEFIHTYSLIHDDHPSMDDDALRRGKPTNHIVFGDDMAILAGDGLLNSAFDVMMQDLLRHADGDPAVLKRHIRAAEEISRSAGIAGMIGGQAADVRPEGAGDTQQQRLLFIHRHKTGALIRASVLAGALLGGADEAALSAMTSYAEQLGLAFQIIDDILDVVGDSRELGKNTGSDEAQGKRTYPSIYGLDASYQLAQQATEEACRSIDPLPGSSFLKELALDLMSRIS